MKKISLSLSATILLLLPLIASAETWGARTNLGTLNTSRRDVSAFITADGKALYMSSDRIGSGSALTNMELYYSRLINSVWSTPEILPAPPNAAGMWDDKPSLTLDGRYMYFYRSAATSAWSVPGDVYVSENINGTWQEPYPVPNVNTQYDEVYPTVSPDGQTLFFGSNRPGGYGDWDLWVAQKVNGVWQSAVNMGPAINTAGREVSPTISYSGRWIFFAYNSSSGAVDIARSENVNGVWQTPVVLPSPVNTAAEESLTYFLDCTNTIYFASTSNTLGSWDMFSASWLDAPGPNVCSSLVIPKGQWRVRVTLLTASTVLKNDAIFIDYPIEQLLIRNKLKNVGTVVTTPFISAEELKFSIRALGNASGMHEIITSDSEYAQVRRTDPLRYIVGFDDPDNRDYDYTDLELLVELVGEEVNPWVEQNYLGESQLVVDTPAATPLEVGIPLTMGLALDAGVSVPAAGISQSTAGIITEGDPYLYLEAVLGAPFAPTGDFLKMELTDGQALANGQQAQVSIAYLDFDNDGLVDGSTIPEQNLSLWQLSPDTGIWTKLPSEINATDNIITGQATSLSLFALGEEIPPAPKQPPLTLSCALADGPMAAANLYLMLLVAAAPVALFRIARRRRG